MYERTYYKWIFEKMKNALKNSMQKYLTVFLMYVKSIFLAMLIVSCNLNAYIDRVTIAFVRYVRILLLVFIDRFSNYYTTTLNAIKRFNKYENTFLARYHIPVIIFLVIFVLLSTLYYKDRIHMFSNCSFTL